MTSEHTKENGRKAIDEITRAALRAILVEGGSALWSARCDAYGEDDDHIVAWSWVRGEAEEGVELVPGSVHVSHPTHTSGRLVRVIR